MTTKVTRPQDLIHGLHLSPSDVVYVTLGRIERDPAIGLTPLPLVAAGVSVKIETLGVPVLVLLPCDR